MKACIPVCLLMVVSLSVFAAGGSGYPLDHVKIDLSDRASLQRGAKYYVNYCLGCHSLNYQRYNRMGKDLGLTEPEVRQNLIFTSNEQGEPTKYGELMTITMNKEYGEVAFGAAPPDLNLIARSRGADWLYTYLRTFYLDDSRPLGVNNAVFPAVSMPHVLWELQGSQKPIYEDHDDGYGNMKPHLVGFEVVKAGKLNVEEYDQMALDLTNFLVYSGEPAKMVRGIVGFWVITFMVIFGFVAWLLKKEYWRDIH